MEPIEERRESMEKLSLEQVAQVELVLRRCRKLSGQLVDQLNANLSKLKANVASREGITLQALLLQEEAAALAKEEIAANCAAGYELIGAFLECKNQLEEVDKIADCLHKINVVMAGLRV